MAKWFNIGGPCRAADNYMLSVTERLPNVVSLIEKKQYFVVHAPRQCGKTTAFQSLADDPDVNRENIDYALDLGLFVDDHGALTPANPIYRETEKRFTLSVVESK